MFLIQNILDSLDDLSYQNTDTLENKLENLSMADFSNIVSWLTFQLSNILPIQSKVNKINSDKELNFFKIELSSLLKELDSPFDVNSINNNETKLFIINFLCSEIFSANIFIIKDKSYKNNLLSEIVHTFHLIMNNLKHDDSSLIVHQIFKILLELKDFIFKNEITIEESILYKFKNKLNDDFWIKMVKLNELFKEEYEIRKKTLITRFDCTLESFKWKQDSKSKLKNEDDLNLLCKQLEYIPFEQKNLEISQIMSLTESDCRLLSDSVISKTHQQCNIIPPKNISQANQGLQQKISLHKYLIGNVPDRGGRTNELMKPATETFQQQQRNYYKPNTKIKFYGNKSRNFNN